MDVYDLECNMFAKLLTFDLKLNSSFTWSKATYVKDV